MEPYNSLSRASSTPGTISSAALTTLSRESYLCTWRLTPLWTDVRKFVHLSILGTCRWDLIKDLSTWLAQPLQHDWNVHNSVCELPRVSVPSGSLALVFALHDLRDFNHLVDELNVQDSNRLLHLLFSVNGLGCWNFSL